jgi:hypothetical protein
MQRLGGAQVEFALRSKFPGTQGASLRMEGRLARGSCNRTMFGAIAKENFLEEDRGSQHEGGSEDICPQLLFDLWHSADISRRSSF